MTTRIGVDEEEQQPAGGQPKTAEPGREAVLAQLEALLASPFFSGSKRCPAMLRHVVLRTLDGNGYELKERTLGIEVFHRAPDYDTNADPVVRLTASDIRKRLAQYYCEPAHESALRIALPSGSYLPEFHLPAPQISVPEAIPVPLPAGKTTDRRSVSWKKAGWGAAAICGVFLAVALVWRVSSLDALERFWAPARGAQSPVLVCVGQPDHALGEAAFQQMQTENSLAMHTLRLDLMTTSDAVAGARMAHLLGRLGVNFTLQGADSTTYSDVRRGVHVLVSGSDNAWSMRAMSNLRYAFAGEQVGSYGRVWIEDRKNPAQHSWVVDFNSPYNALSQDYAIVARFQDASSGQLTYLVAGIGANGTVSAAECLSDRGCLASIMKADPSKGRNSNLEAVLGTQVIGGRSGPPQILAVTSW